MKQRLAFTLIEVLVAVTIVAVLTAIGAVSYSSANRNSRDAKRLADVEDIRTALEMYRADNGHYPDTSAGLSALTDGVDGDIYLVTIPQDPKSSSSGCDYEYISDGQSYTLGVCLEKAAGQIVYFTPMGQIESSPTLIPTPSSIPTLTPTPAPTSFPTPTMGVCPSVCFFDSDCLPCGSGCTCPQAGLPCSCPF